MGKILTDSKRLNIAIILLLINAVLVLISGLTYAILGTFMPYHVTFTGKTESEVSAYDTELMVLISAFIRLMGIYCIALAITAIFVTKYGIREREKWAWYGFLITYFIIIPPQLFITWTITGFFGMPFVNTVIVTILWIIALCVSYSEIF